MVAKMGIAIPSDLEPMSITPRHYFQSQLGVIPRSNTYKRQIAIPSDSEHISVTPKHYSQPRLGVMPRSNAHRLQIARNCDLVLVSITSRYYSQLRLGVMPRSNAHRLQIARNCDSHFCSLVLDQTVRSSLFIGLHFELETGPFFPRPDCIFRSRLRFGHLERSPKKATVRTGPDCSQSMCERLQLFYKVYKQRP